MTKPSINQSNRPAHHLLYQTHLPKPQQYVPIAMLYALVRWATGTLDPASLRYPWKVRFTFTNLYAVAKNEGRPIPI